MEILSLSHITKSYPHQPVLSDVNLSVSSGACVGIIGRSGSGKTTLLNIIGLLDRADGGNYTFCGQKIDASCRENARALLRRDQIGFVVQNYALIPDETAFDNIAVPLICKKMKASEIKKRVQAISEQTGISALLGRRPYELSGGECQRVAIARALIRDPKILLADEPTGALDEETEPEILQVFQALNRGGVTMILVTHNPSVERICTQRYQMVHGCLQP